MGASFKLFKCFLQMKMHFISFKSFNNYEDPDEIGKESPMVEYTFDKLIG